MKNYSLLTILLAVVISGLTIQAFVVHWLLGFVAAIFLGLSVARTTLVVRSVRMIGIPSPFHSLGIFIRVAAWTCFLLLSALALGLGFVLSIGASIFGVVEMAGAMTGRGTIHPAYFIFGGTIASGLLYLMMSKLHKVDDGVLHFIFRSMAIRVARQPVVQKTDPFS